MKLKYSICVFFYVFMLFSKVCYSEHFTRENIDISGFYSLKTNKNTTIEVRVENNQQIVMLSGGGSGSSNGQVAADCFIRGIGKRRGNSLIADFTEIETDVTSYSKEEAQSEKRKVQIIFGSNSAKVIKADTFGYCGLGANFIGTYVK